MHTYICTVPTKDEKEVNENIMISDLRVQFLNEDA